VTGSAAAIAAALAERRTFTLTSHARPDGDAIGSSMALALALEALGKQAAVVLRDRVPTQYRAFPAVDRIVIADTVPGPADAAVLLECSDLGRPEVAGLDQSFVINIDHHLGNAMYGGANWFDESAAACGEMVAQIIDELGVAWSRDIAAHLYLALSPDTGGFRYGPISPRTFDVCRRIAETGVQTAQLSRQIFDSFSIGRVKLTGALLTAMELYFDDRLALLRLDDALLAACGASTDDTEGLVNLPLGAEEVVVSVLFKQQTDARFRVSLRSKGAVDVRAVAGLWHGGGHRNAAGCTVESTYEELKPAMIQAVGRALADAAP
jgi:phosphoesterase RecJ-like protein